MKTRSLFSKLLIGAVAIGTLSMCKKKEEETISPGSGNNMSVEAVSTCTYTIQPSETTVDGASIPAGSVVCLPAGTRGALLLKNFKGTAAKPITFINKGGKVTIKNSGSASYGLKTMNCSNFKILGNGDPSVKYGINVDGGHITVAIDYLSTDFEIANLEVQNAGFAGVMAKTDPSCDKATQRGNFVLRNALFHDNYVHHVKGEGFYIGNSFYLNGRDLSCGKAYPHSIENVKVYNNITDNTGCEGIQVGCVLKGCEIYNNKVTNPGRDPFAPAQNNGIQIGEGTGGKCYNNLVKNAPGNGIICLGLGDNVVFNNSIINSGASGIFCDERYTTGQFFKFINNTIINPAVDGVRLYSEKVGMNYVMNNVIIKPGSGKYITKNNAGLRLTEASNYTSMDINSCKFVNQASNDYRINSGSPLIDKGTNVSSHGVTIDFNGNGRPYNNAYDIGVAEFRGTNTTNPTTPGGGTTTPTPPTSTPTPAPGTGTKLSFRAADDVFIEGTRVVNQSIIRATNGSRISYIKFNVKGLSGAKPKSAILKLYADTYAGKGSVTISLGNNANWSTGTITSANKPNAVATIASLNETFTTSKEYQFNVTNAIKGDGSVTLMVYSSGDIGFSAVEKGKGAMLDIYK